MPSKHEGSNDLSMKVKKENQKRAWSKEEELALIAGLKGLVAKGWKSDNGFRINYMLKLEEAIRDKIPSTDIRAKPHIDSKINAWKRTYAALRDILARSGVGFNLRGDFKIDCDDEVWQEICRVNDKWKNWRKTSWSYYDDWQLVFGKDRATGEGAAELAEMLDEYKKDDNCAKLKKAPNKHTFINVEEEDVGETAAAEDSVGQSTYVSNKPVKKKNKRRLEDTITSLVDIVGDMEKTNKAKLDAVNSGFAKSNQQKQARAEMWPLLERLEGLSDEEMFDAGELMFKVPECLELFMTMSEVKRPAYVRRITKRSMD